MSEQPYSEVRMDELNSDEFFDVARVLKPGLTRPTYEAMWEDFQKYKAEYLRKKELN